MRRVRRRISAAVGEVPPADIVPSLCVLLVRLRCSRAVAELNLPQAMLRAQPCQRTLKEACF